MLDQRIKRVYLKHLIFGIEPITDEKGRFGGAELTFSNKSDNEIYSKSHINNFEVVPYFNQIKLRLNANQLVALTATMVEGVSTYLYNLRYQIIGEKHLETYLNLTPYGIRNKNNYKVRITNNRKKQRKMDKEDKETSLSRYKLMLAIIDKEEENEKDGEIIELRFTKRDVVLMLLAFKNIMSKNYRVFNFSYIPASTIDSEEEILSSNQSLSISKIDNSIVFGDVFLHGQEILNLNYVIDSLVFEYEVEKNLKEVYNNYRQLKIFPYSEFLLGLQIAKIEVKEDEYTSEFEHNRVNDFALSIPINNKLIAGLFLFMSTEQLKHSKL